MPTRATLALDEYDGSARSGDLTVTNDGNSNDGEAGEGDNTWASVFNNGPAGCAEEQGRRPAARLPPTTRSHWPSATLFFFQTAGDDIFDPFSGEPQSPLQVTRRSTSMRWRI